MNKNFILINLNQTVSKAQLVEQKAERSRWALFGFVVIIFLGLTASSYTINKDIHELRDARVATIEKIKQDTKALHKEGQIDISKKNILQLSKLESGQILWSPKLQALAKITPDDMAVTELEYKNERLIISAISKLHPGEKEFSVIDNFIQLLKNNSEFADDFKTITFLNSERVRSKGQEMLAFRVIAQSNKKKIRRK
ncbi:MAG: PilN domain-containing protein [Candidatus Marinimicrobia bacterium]|nr:PilN domain-containing protein [Candidatus Neomarinimicrobiota bacterium]